MQEVKQLTTRNVNAISYAAQHGQAFTTSGALAGGWCGGPDLPTYPPGIGRMPREEWETVKGHAVYMITSYGVPIVWRVDGGEWVRTSARYSVTTTRHMNTAWHAVGGR